MSDLDFTRIKSFKDLKRENLAPDNEKSNQELVGLNNCFISYSELNCNYDFLEVSKAKKEG